MKLRNHIIRDLLRGLLLVLFLGSETSLLAQQEIDVSIDSSQAAAAVRIAVPYPRMAFGITSSMIHQDFVQPLMGDLAFSEIFTIRPLPPGDSPTIEMAQRVDAQAFLDLNIERAGEDYLVEARLYDVSTRQLHVGRKYRGPSDALTRIAHTITNDLVLFFNGKPGLFLSQIVFVSDRDGAKELYIMDYDGSNQRRVTAHRSLALTPDWSADNERLVYTTIRRDESNLYIINRRGGGRIKLETGVGLNTSPAFSPDGKRIAFVGSLGGNPDIYVINDDGKNRRRLTSEPSIESTPSWSPTGRQIAFTSGRAGSPQIYVMDAEGTNIRRISFDGNWNDDAVWHPNGELLAYTSLVHGRYQIRLVNMTTGESTILAGLGSNEQPSWSPDGRWLVFMSNRTGKWQIYRMGIDGRQITQLTREENNQSPTWSR